MKKIILIILCLFTLTSCANLEKPQGEKLTIEEAYEQYGLLYNQNKTDVENKPLFNTIYMKEERKDIEYDRTSDQYEEKYYTTIISYNKENYHYHYESFIDNKTTNITTQIFEDRYIKDEKLHFFRTYTIDKRVAYKKYYICDLDYLWTYESEYSGYMEQVLGEEYLKVFERALSKDNHLLSIENNYLFSVDGLYNRVPDLASFTKLLSYATTAEVYYDTASDILTFDKKYAETEEVIEYNLRVKSAVVYTNGYLSEIKDEYYNGEYAYTTYIINSEIPLPTFNLTDYEETEPGMITINSIDFIHKLN